MKIEYQWTKERFLEAAKANYDLKMKSPNLSLIGYFGVSGIIVGAYLAWATGVYGILSVSSALVLYWYLLRWPLQRLQLASSFKKHASKDKLVSWTVEPDTFSITSESGGGSYKWSAITDVSETKAGFLIRQYPVFYWLPKDRFESEEDIAWFRNEIVSKTPAGKHAT